MEQENDIGVVIDDELTQMETVPKPKLRRGFAAMNPEKQREIASLGGKAAHVKGTAHEFQKGEEARAAGRKGGIAQAERIRRALAGADT